jgi:hypothetical protein
MLCILRSSNAYQIMPTLHFFFYGKNWVLNCLFMFYGSVKVVRSGDLVSYCAEEGVRILGEGKFLVSDSFPGNERTKYCFTSKVILPNLSEVLAHVLLAHCSNLFY